MIIYKEFYKIQWDFNKNSVDFYINLIARYIIKLSTKNYKIEKLKFNILY
jgi:hypothetical protein